MDYDYLARIKASITLYTRKKTSNILDGEFGSIYRGRSFDFDDLREYVYGDSVRDIDWKSSSKTGRVLIRRFIADKKHNILFVGDAGAKFRGDTDKGEAKTDIALNVLGTISYLVNDHGDDYALLYLNKGFTAREARLQLDRLRAAGIRYGLNVIFGASGRDGRFKNARETAALVNYADPYLIFTGTIHADPGCKLYEDMKEGKFIECTIREYLEEEKEFLELLELTHCKYFGLHPANVVPMMGMLPEHKERLMDRLIKAEQEIPAEAMDSVPLRFGEGGIAY